MTLDSSHSFSPTNDRKPINPNICLGQGHARSFDVSFAPDLWDQTKPSAALISLTSIMSTCYWFANVVIDVFPRTQKDVKRETCCIIPLCCVMSDHLHFPEQRWSPTRGSLLHVSSSLFPWLSSHLSLSIKLENPQKKNTTISCAWPLLSRLELYLQVELNVKLHTCICICPIIVDTADSQATSATFLC